MPKPFLNKLIVHGAIGFFCVLFGCIYGFITDDQIFLLMSLCIGGNCHTNCESAAYHQDT